MNSRRPYQWGGGIVALFLLLLPILLSQMGVNLAIEVLIYALFGLSFNLLYGFGGMLPFGHAALFGVGGYGTALLLKFFPGTSLVLSLLAALLMGVVAGAIIGFFCVRLKGAYSALLSFAFQMFIFAVALKWRSVTNGDDGMSVIRPDLHLGALGSVSMSNLNNFYYFTLLVVAIGTLSCYLFLKTPYGNSLICTREKDTRAYFLGYNVFLTRFVAFMASGFLAGLAGGLFVLFQKFVGTSCVSMDMGMVILLMVVIGGSGEFLGPVLGAAFYVLFQDWISSLTEHWWMWLGIVFMVVVLYFEGGLISLFKIEKIRLWGWNRREMKGQ